MTRNNSSQFSLTTGTDLAFALVVFVSFFTAFSTSSITSLFLITVIIFLGIAYLSNGIYGFAYAKKSSSLLIKLVYFLLQCLIGGLIVYYGKGAGFTALILLPVVAHTAILLDQDWSLITNIGIFATYLVSIWAFSHSLGQVWQGLPTFFVGQVFILIFTQMAITEQKAREKLEKLAQELSEANRHLSEYADQVHALAVIEERNRFAREIHDGLGHYLTTINMQISAAAAVVNKDPESASHMLENAQKMTSEALVDVRNSVYALRQDKRESENLVDRIRGLVKDLQSDDLKIEFVIEGLERPINPQADLTIFRTAQEALNNAKKHSKATKIIIFLDYSTSNLIQFEVKDNGIGTENPNAGFGLVGIQERVRLMNGEVTIESKKDEGFSVKIRIPG